MHLRKLGLVNFKNYEELNLEFSPYINCFVGKNGAGKTNLLDAIYYLSFCKSYINPIDSQNICNEAPFFVVDGEYQVEEEVHRVYCGVKRGKKKTFKRNGKEYERYADHIGNIPLVMISPIDTNLIHDGSAERRKFLDGIISQFDKYYLDCILKYSRVLQQRNQLLKEFDRGEMYDAEMMEPWNMKMIPLVNEIDLRRERFLEEFIPYFERHYNAISGSEEKVSLNYKTSWKKETGIEQALHQVIREDLKYGYTTIGPHKDDLVFKLEGRQVKKFASQGQQKTYLTALKLAQYDVIEKETGMRPLLLLDDIFDKLDANRVSRIVQMSAEGKFGQTFITDTHKDRVNDVLGGLDIDYRVFEINNSKLAGYEEKIQ